jgi:hypothetical protein
MRVENTFGAVGMNGTITVMKTATIIKAITNQRVQRGTNLPLGKREKSSGREIAPMKFEKLAMKAASPDPSNG